MVVERLLITKKHFYMNKKYQKEATKVTEEFVHDKLFIVKDQEIYNSEKSWITDPHNIW